MSEDPTRCDGCGVTWVEFHPEGVEMCCGMMPDASDDGDAFGGHCPRCCPGIGHTPVPPVPAQSLDGLPWRTEPPDADGWWWLCQVGGGRRFDEAYAVRFGPGRYDHKPTDFYFPGADEPCSWSKGWRCCPVVL